ncbi:pyridoxal-phosphate-dependent serine hydroxymethyltransferase, putative [Actinidia rufa]|uniref:Pyridoxal-phosphate-dependent serine hydroxymethyltransferase, putative n=1 Tax=Actinidia rufa TaxID=165716 RepID=A0A7J0DI95_9ERIC|nr:pyridoxal-phosphate-dependent serine hydroxymethyltransferase, putative [Actinidia rufa]
MNLRRGLNFRRAFDKSLTRPQLPRNLQRVFDESPTKPSLNLLQASNVLARLNGRGISLLKPDLARWRIDKVRRHLAKVYEYGKSLSPLLWTWVSSQKLDGFGKLGEEAMVGSNIGGGDFISGSHCSTVEKLYAWEKKLYLEVKNAEMLKREHEKRAEQLRKLELNRGDYVKTDKTKKEIEKMESRMMVASQAIETTSAEIV